MNCVWYVSDSEPGWPPLFDTKEAAEQWARILFPNEDPQKRYTRIFYRTVYQYEENEARLAP
jgi:hypothetical protein